MHIIIQGRYTINGVAVDQNGDELLCMDLDITI